MIGSMASTFGDFDEEEVAEMRQECRKEVLPKVQAQFDNPEQLRQTMYKQAKNQYMTVRQLKAKLRSYFADLREDNEIGKDVVAEYEGAYEGLFEFVRINDRIVRKLARVAETEGVDKATQKETRYAITREMFPTPEEYRAFTQGGIEAVRNFYQQAQNALMTDGEMGQALGGQIGAIGKVMEKAQEMCQKIQGNYLEKTIQEIYG